ncbi:MAG: DUF3459 domain-containing protein [Chloroflexi bacterium]|nr:DUF3459 domain-containing protein [Chloroflexota bacterium]
MSPETRSFQQLAFIYGKDAAREVWPSLKKRIDAFRERNPHLWERVRPPTQRLTEKDAILITYGDQFRQPNRPPLQTLNHFLRRHLGDAVSGVHILPFFPYSSDDGFSVIDYKRIDPNLGDWADIARIGQGYRLMFDAVINHVSRASAWFRGFLHGEKPYTDYFIVMPADADLSKVVRPRALPLLTRVETTRGEKYVWTTFSADQIDLNYANPQVALAIIDVLLYYVEHGAEIIRLDAIAYLWKEPGTSCIHLPQTHAMVKLWRAVLDAVAPDVLLITETNVPHEENISYFGEPLPETGSTDEAQMVYNFSLAPLTLHAFLTGDASRLSQWAATLEAPAPGATFFNFIASHDGIGVRPAEGILSVEEIEALVEQTLAHGGQIGYRAHPDGAKSAYELNITLYDFLNDPHHPDDNRDVARFLASQAVLLTLAGVPGIYVHSLFGSRNCHRCYAETGRPRSLNREKFAWADLQATLANASSHQRRVLDGYRRLLQLRREHPAFHPDGEQRILALNKAVFAVMRRAPEFTKSDDVVISLVNVSDATQTVHLDPTAVPELTPGEWQDLVGGGRYHAGEDGLRVKLGGYEVMWLSR